MTAKQAAIDAIHVKLRESSAQLGEERRRLETLQERAKERESRKLKIANLKRARDEEEYQLSQILQQHGQANGDVQMRLGDADKGLSISPGAVPNNILSDIAPNPHQSQTLDQAQRQLLASLPSAAILRARLNAYIANNAALEGNVQELQSKSADLTAKYRRIVSLCTKVDEDRVDSLLENLLRAVESEQNDVELGRVRDFLQRVDGVE